MTPERWKRTEELYHAARARPPGERAAFLAEACRDDDAMRRDVESLLNEPESHDGLLDGPARLTPAHVVADLAPAAMTGRSLGGYHLQALLGAGGMGEVYRARDAKLGRDVAIKILPRAFTSDPDRLARFEREARMLAALNHPNICAIYGLEEAAPSPASGQASSTGSAPAPVRFLILELVDGDTLAQRLADSARPQSRGAGLPVREALTIARQIAEALEVAHEKGIVHRDLKPANINITPDGVVKVLDFGLAKTVGGEGSTPDLTQAPEETRSDGRGAVMGTAAYMSPEQARGLAIDKRTDIWAFGCVLYEMLTGRVTFAGETVSDSIAKILEREPDWSTLPAATPAAIRRLLFRCLVKDPKQRLRDMGDVRIEIDAIDEVLPGASRETTPRRWPAALGLTVVALSLFTAVASWLTRGTSAPPPNDNLLANAKFTPFTNFEGSELDAAISPDGKFVAFLADRDSAFHVWVKQVGAGPFVNLTPGKDDQRNVGPNRSVGFSGDGSEVWVNGTAGRRLSIMPLIGGAPRVFLNERAVNVAWSPDGTRLLYFTYDPGDPVFVADSTGGNARQIFVSEKGDHNHFPTWSTDGQWIYYAHGIQAVSEFDVWRIPSSGGRPERLTELNSDVRYLTPIDARTVLFVSPEQDGSGPWLWALDVERRVTHRVSSGMERYLSVAATADGRRLVATVSKSTATLWSAPILDRLVEERDVKPYPVPTARALGPRFGTTSLFYLSSNGPGDGLWRLQDGKAVEIWKGADDPLLLPPGVSPRGDRVAVVLRKQGTLHLTIVSADGADHQSLAERIDVRGAPAWSPDARWIVTGGNDAQGPGLFKIPVDGGAPIRLATGSAFDPVWSPDGGVVVYTGQQTATAPLLAVRLDGRPVNLPPIQVLSGGGGRARFLPSGKLVYLQGPVGMQDFWLLDLTTNQTRQLTRLSNPATTSAFDVAPDGSQIVFDRVQEHSDVRLIDLPK